MKLWDTIKQNKVITTMIILFFLVNILDSLTALFILPFETNPIYNLTGSIWPIIIGKIGASIYVAYLFYKYKMPSNQYYFFFITMLFYGIIVISLGFASNIYVYNHMETAEYQALQPTVQSNTTYYSQVVGILYIIPLIISNLVFWIYEKTRDGNVIDRCDCVSCKYTKITKEDLRR